MKYLNRYKYDAKKYYLKFFRSNLEQLSKLINKNKNYYSACISRFYMDFKKKNHVLNYIKHLKKIWDKKDVLIIEGEKSMLGIGNDLFDNINSIKRIICPALNAFNVYEKIINSVKNKIKTNTLILIALGPTATVLSYDLFKLGYQAIDIGHIDIEYEWFLRKAKNKIPISNKNVAEVDQIITQTNKTIEKNYFTQIIEKILD